MTRPTFILLMGPSGCGKSTVGPQLAGRLAGLYLEGDDFHPPANKAKMATGTPLDDADRWPWFDLLREAVARALADQPDRPVVLACSALRRRYRDYLLAGHPPGTASIVFLSGTRDLIASRLSDRVHEYMPATLLDSQFAALEAPDPDEQAIIAEIGRTPDALVDAIVRELGAR